MADPEQPTEPAFADNQTLLPAIAQDAATGRVLMLAYMNRAAYLETLRTGRAVYYSRRTSAAAAAQGRKREVMGPMMTDDPAIRPFGDRPWVRVGGRGCGFSVP